MKQLNLTAIFIFTLLSAQGQSKNFIDQPYLEVTGNADTLLTPDEIYIRISISEKDTKDRMPVEELELKMYNALKTQGIDVDKNLTSTDMSSNFKYYFLKEKDVLKSKSYLLKVNDAVTASKAFIELEGLGISNTSIDRVDHSNLNQIRSLMRSSAVGNAKTRAMSLATPLNQTVGSAIHIADNEVYNVGNQLSGRVMGIVAVGYSTKKKSNEELPKIEFEKIKVSANVNVHLFYYPNYLHSRQTKTLFETSQIPAPTPYYNEDNRFYHLNLFTSTLFI
jgi:uncharacterized protein